MKTFSAWRLREREREDDSLRMELPSFLPSSGAIQPAPSLLIVSEGISKFDDTYQPVALRAEPTWVSFCHTEGF